MPLSSRMVISCLAVSLANRLAILAIESSAMVASRPGGSGGQLAGGVRLVGLDHDGHEVPAGQLHARLAQLCRAHVALLVSLPVDGHSGSPPAVIPSPSRIWPASLAPT